MPPSVPNSKNSTLTQSLVLWTVNGLVVVALATSTLIAQRQTVGRQIRMIPGTHLREALRPEDKSLVVIYPGDPPLEVTVPQDVSLTKWLFEVADGVVRARVDRRQGRLTSIGDWVQSTVTATVIEVFKAPRGANLRANSTFTFIEEGGEVRIDGVRIAAILPWARGFEISQTYLMALAIDPDSGRIVVGPTATYELKNARFERLARPLDRPDLVDGIERELSEQVLVEFRDLARTRRR